jgi:hypothetical protein
MIIATAKAPLSVPTKSVKKSEHVPFLPRFSSEYIHSERRPETGIGEGRESLSLALKLRSTCLSASPSAGAPTKRARAAQRPRLLLHRARGQRDGRPAPAGPPGGFPPVTRAERRECRAPALEPRPARAAPADSVLPSHWYRRYQALLPGGSRVFTGRSKSLERAV